MEKQIRDSYTLKIVTDFTEPDMEPVLKEWSQRTQNKEHVVPRKPEWMRNNYEYATIISHFGEIVACAGIIQAFDDLKKPIFFDENGKKFEVHELCTNVVDKNHEGHKLAHRMIFERLHICRNNNWVPVIVTKEEAIIHIAEKFGMIQTYRSYHLKSFGEEIRDCDCANRGGKKFVGTRCKTCPINGGKSILVLLPTAVLPVEYPY